MAIALINHTFKAATNSATTVTSSGIDTTGANFLIVSVINNNLNGFTLSDSNSNTWTPLTSYTFASTYTEQLLYAVNAIVGAGHTFTVTASTTSVFGSFLIQAFSGVKTTSPFDVQNGASGSSIGGNVQPGSVTPGENNELLVTGIQTPNGAAPTIDSSFTITDTINGSFFGANGGMAYKIQTTAGAENPNWAVGNTQWITGIATFKAAPPPAINSNFFAFF